MCDSLGTFDSSSIAANIDLRRYRSGKRTKVRVSGPANTGETAVMAAPEFAPTGAVRMPINL